MKLELIADSFYNKSTVPDLKGAVLDLPEKYLKDFPNTFKVYVEKPIAESVVIPVVAEEIAEPTGEDDLLDVVKETTYTPSQIKVMNGTKLRTLAPSLGLDPEAYELVKDLRKAVEDKLFNEGAV